MFVCNRESYNHCLACYNSQMGHHGGQNRRSISRRSAPLIEYYVSLHHVTLYYFTLHYITLHANMRIAHWFCFVYNNNIFVTARYHSGNRHSLSNLHFSIVNFFQTLFSNFLTQLPICQSCPRRFYLVDRSVDGRCWITLLRWNKTNNFNLILT